MKTKFFYSTLIAMVISSTAFAEFRAIPQAQLEAYKKAVALATQQSSINNCKESGNLTDRALGEYVQEAESGKVDVDGNQPILIFERHFPTVSMNLKSITTITSTADYKRLRSIKVEELLLSDVNTGDLKNPNIVKEYIVITIGECN